jgi:hypothetical protein
VSLVRVIKQEMQVWRSGWQHVETFLDRIDSARETDQDYADKAQAMLQIAGAIEEERMIRTGTGLDVPLEIAEQRAGVRKTSELGDISPHAFEAKPPEAPAFKTRLPGAYDVELSVAPLKGILNDGGELKSDFTRYADLLVNPTLFSRFNDTTGTWDPVIAPGYDFGAWPAGDVFRLVDVDHGLFPVNHRVAAAQKGMADPDDTDSAIELWTALRNKRRSNLDQPTKDKALITVLGTFLSSGKADDKTRQAIHDGAKRGSDACTKGADAIDKLAAGPLAGAVFPELPPSYDFPSVLKGASIELRSRAKAYQGLRDAVDAYGTGKTLPSGLPPWTALTQGLGTLQNYGDIGGNGLYAAEGVVVTFESKVLADSRGAVGTVLDEAINARVEYPDGTLRILRMLEWTFRRAWEARKVWFRVRRIRYLEPLLTARFLQTFLKSLASMYGSLPNLQTGIAFRARLAATAPLVTGAVTIKLAPGAHNKPLDLSGIDPGQVAVVEGDAGERRALAILLGPDSNAGGLQRLRISPARISMSGNLPPPSVAGLITQGKLDAGPVKLDDAGLRDGVASGSPGDDGVVEELVALWSRLCLVLGGDAVRVALKATRPGSSGELPTFLDRNLKLPVQGPLETHAQKLVLSVAAMKNAGLDLDGTSKPIVARPGELLLVSGKDDKGHPWQGVVEVLSIVRTTPDKVNDDPVLPPAASKICCQGPGTVIVIQVKDTTFPVALTSGITLSRDFQGFGAPSLATGVLLPKDLDPRNDGEEIGPYRGPELKAACDILSGWMWQPP